MIGRTTRRIASSCFSRAGAYRPRQYHCRPTSREPPVPRLDASGCSAARSLQCSGQEEKLRPSPANPKRRRCWRQWSVRLRRTGMVPQLSKQKSCLRRDSIFAPARITAASGFCSNGAERLNRNMFARHSRRLPLRAASRICSCVRALCPAQVFMPNLLVRNIEWLGAALGTRGHDAGRSATRH